MDQTIDKPYIIKLAKDCLNWKEAKIISWYKLENRWLGGVSPHELVNRGEGQKVIDFLESRRSDPNSEE
jgi:hypothetical protein